MSGWERATFETATETRSNRQQTRKLWRGLFRRDPGAGNLNHR